MDAVATPPAGSLDAIGGQPVLAEARAAMGQAVATAWADPTQRHHAGRQAGSLLDAARASLAASLSACQVPGAPAIRPEEVFLTASRADAERLAVTAGPGPRVVSAVEATGLLDRAEAWPDTRIAPVDALGRVQLPIDADPIDAGPINTGLLIVQAANPEVGTRQPADLGAAPRLMDAAQAIARDPIPGSWTTLIASARDWAGPAGVAVCVVRGGRPTAPAVRGWLDGFPNIPAAVGAARALELLVPDWQARARRDRERIEAIRAAAAAIPDVEVVGDPVDRLPHVVTFSVLYVSGEAIVDALDAQGIAVASGSACVDEASRPSHVLAAMGAYTGGNVRVSIPFGCTDETIERFLDVLPGTIADLRDDTVNR